MSHIKVRPNQKEQIITTFSTALPCIMKVTQNKQNVLIDNLYRCRKTFTFEDGEKIYIPELLPANSNLYQFIGNVLCDVNFDEPVHKSILQHISNASGLMSKSLLLNYRPQYDKIIKDLQKLQAEANLISKLVIRR